MKKWVLVVIVAAVLVVGYFAFFSCPSYPAPAPDWCAGGHIMEGGKTKSGCVLPPTCVDANGQHHVQVMDANVCTAGMGNWWMGECQCGGDKGYMCPNGWECAFTDNSSNRAGVCKLIQ